MTPEDAYALVVKETEALEAAGVPTGKSVEAMVDAWGLDGNAVASWCSKSAATELTTNAKMASMGKKAEIDVSIINEAIVLSMSANLCTALLTGYALHRDQERTARQALERIKTEEGKVCPEFQICEHESCRSSYAAWAIADEALTGDTQKLTDYRGD